MKTIDNKIKYYELLMYYSDTSNYINYELPNGYHFELYKDGDITDWINIHISSGEFTSYEEGEEIFHTFYDSFIDELDKRCFFIVDDNTLEKIGTSTISLLKDKQYGFSATVDWVAIKKEYQGKKLSKPLICHTIYLANILGHKDILLHTQTNTWLAALIYLDYGFNILNKEQKEGWGILKTLTHHPKLNEFEEIEYDNIFDKRNIEIENILINMYGTDEFNYEVKDINGLHDVYTYINGNTYKYEYYYDNNKIVLKEIQSKYIK